MAEYKCDYFESDTLSTFITNDDKFGLSITENNEETQIILSVSDTKSLIAEMTRFIEGKY